MQNKTDKAIENFKSGFNCSQAVLCAYATELGLTEEQAYKLAEALGGGIGGMRTGTCGALSGAFMAVGLMNSDGVPGGKTKQDTYALVQEISDEFEKKNTSCICKDLIGAEGKPRIRSCIGCVEDASDILHKVLADRLK